jgi:GT2 family glycosyltransferase
MSKPAGPSDVTVVVATRNRSSSLTVTLTHLRSLPERPAIVVVDNDSQDETSTLVAREFPDVTLIRAPRNMGAAGRTVGAAVASTPYVAFSDDDSWWEAGSLTRAASIMESAPRLGAVAATIRVGDDGREDPIVAELRRGQMEASHGAGVRVFGFLACAVVVRRDAFLAVGGFHPRLLIGGEEELLALDFASLGWTIAYVEDVIAIHHPFPRTNHRSRQALQLRNALWVAWLRRRRPQVVRETSRLIGAGLRAGHVRPFLDALGGMGWVLRERDPIPLHVERLLGRQ